MTHPSLPTRHLVERKTIQKNFSPTARCPAIVDGDSEFAETAHLGALYVDIINKLPLRKFLSDLTWPKSRYFICSLSGEKKERAERDSKAR